MISWRKYSEHKWEFKYKNKVFDLSSQADVIAASLVIDIPEEEIKEAIMQMDEHDHNYAEFGIWRSFLFSERV